MHCLNHLKSSILLLSSVRSVVCEPLLGLEQSWAAWAAWANLEQSLENNFLCKTLHLAKGRGVMRGGVCCDSATHSKGSAAKSSQLTAGCQPPPPTDSSRHSWCTFGLRATDHRLRVLCTAEIQHTNIPTHCEPARSLPSPLRSGIQHSPTCAGIHTAMLCYAHRSPQPAAHSPQPLGNPY